MEQNEEVYCKKPEDKKCFCLWIIVAIIAVALSFFVGVLTAALTAIIPILEIGGIVSIIIILTLLLALAIVNVICCKKNEKQKYYC